MGTDIVFIHAPTVYDFRKKPIFYGPVSDVVPSSPVFEMYPIGFMTMSSHLEAAGFKTRIINLAVAGDGHGRGRLPATFPAVPPAGSSARRRPAPCGAGGSVFFAFS